MPAEHRAVLILLGLAAAGHGVRHFADRPGDAPGAIQVIGAAPGGSAAAHRDSVLRRARPLADGERIDADRATATELERLPGVGPGLARRIVADRKERGPFGALEGLDRVPGVGKALLARIGASVSFSAQRSNSGREAVRPLHDRLDLNTASASELDGLPGIGPAKARAIVAYREAHGPFASMQSLSAVPGIGPSLMAKIAVAAEVR